MREAGQKVGIMFAVKSHNEVIRELLAKLLRDNTQFCQVKFWESEDKLVKRI